MLKGSGGKHTQLSESQWKEIQWRKTTKWQNTTEKKKNETQTTK